MKSNHAQVKFVIIGRVEALPIIIVREVWSVRERERERERERYRDRRK